MDEFADLLSAFKRDAGLEQSDDLQNPFEVTVDDIPVTVSCETRVGELQVVLYAPLGQIEEADELAAYRTLLDANVLWKVSNDCTLGVKADTRQVIICFRMSVPEVGRRSLADVIDVFVDESKEWAAVLDAVRSEKVTRNSLESGSEEVLFIQA